MGVNPAAFFEYLGERVNKLINVDLQAPTPEFLFHYTDYETVIKIVQSQSMWVTCLSEQKDPSELLYSIQLLKEAAQRALDNGLPPFSSEVVRCLVEEILKRRDWIYIACFRADQGTKDHSVKYGDCCLSLPFDLTRHQFHCADHQASLWFRPVVYDRDLQVSMIREAFRLTIDAINQFHWETIEGPWMPSSARSCARSIAQIFIGFVAGFKDREFEKEHEWRLVCSPGAALAHSAPLMFDESFSRLIKHHEERKYIPLDGSSYSRWPSRKLPFTQIGVSADIASRNVSTLAELWNAKTESDISIVTLSEN